MDYADLIKEVPEPESVEDNGENDDPEVTTDVADNTTVPGFDASPMTGTTGTDYTLVAVFKTGKVGFRLLGGDEYRVRVEPAGEFLTLPFPKAWKRPGGEPETQRYSIVLNGANNARAAISHACQILVGAAIA